MERSGSNVDASQHKELVEEVKQRLKKQHPNLPVGKYGRDDDKLLLWFLKDRKFDVEQAATKLVNFIKWRQDFGVNKITEDSLRRISVSDKAYLHTSPDIEGRPVLVVVATRHFPVGRGVGGAGVLAMVKAPWWAAALVIICALLWRLLMNFWWRPRAMAWALRRQGIQGPPRKFIVGNLLDVKSMRQNSMDNAMERLSHDLVEHVMPEYYHWSKKYGKQYVCWWGREPRITISDPETIRVVLSKKPGLFVKSRMRQASFTDVVGYGLGTIDGEEWAHHRRVVAPAFFPEKLKGMIGRIANCTTEMLDAWEAKIQGQSELEVSADLSKMTADVISHMAFGSSYQKGSRVLELLTALLHRINLYNWLPGGRLLTNFKMRRWKNELNSILLSVINQRRNLAERGRGKSYGNDLLGLMIAESANDNKFNNQMLVDECKTFYLAGHETTTALLTWTMLLLAAHPHWQERARAEVQDTCKDDIPDAEMLNKSKLVGMILFESLRLYPPATMLFRDALDDTKVCDLYVPKGTGVIIPVLAVHHNPDLWGADATVFNPERFKDGILQACKHPNAFMPFSFGPRVCVGQAFALIEAKVALAMILRRFSFQLSPSYRHNPVGGLSLKPLHGLQLILKKL